MKEYGLMLLNTKKGGFVQKFTTIDGTLRGDVDYVDKMLAGAPLKINSTPEFKESSLACINGMASMMNDEDATEHVPVIVEVEYTIKGLDGKEYDVKKVTNRSRERHFKRVLRNFIKRN
jgi:hypothetical protein|nr:MAG TPA: hypothetical protein [Caudoviricetes sp.]